MVNGSTAVKPDVMNRRSFFAADDKWNGAVAKAKKRGETVADVLRRALDQYLEED